MQDVPPTHRAKRTLNLSEAKKILEAIRLQGSLGLLKMRIQVDNPGLPILKLVMYPIPINDGPPPIEQAPNVNEIAVNLATSVEGKDLESPEAIRAIAAYSMLISVLHEFMEAFTLGDDRPLNPHSKSTSSHHLLVELQDAAKVLFRKYKHLFK